MSTTCSNSSISNNHNSSKRINSRGKQLEVRPIQQCVHPRASHKAKLAAALATNWLVQLQLLLLLVVLELLLHSALHVTGCQHTHHSCRLAAAAAANTRHQDLHQQQQQQQQQWRVNWLPATHHAQLA
jgi:hypothetical protein